MRTKDSREQIDYLKQASDAGSLDKIFEGLDVLGSLAWKINRPVFDIVSEVWNTGEAFADIPIRDSLTRALDAEKPDNVETDPRARDTYRQRVRKALQERRAAHSNRCDVNYKLEIGRAVRLSYPLALFGEASTDCLPLSSSARSFTSRTTSTSAVARTRSHPTSPTSATTSVAGSSCSTRRSR